MNISLFWQCLLTFTLEGAVNQVLLKFNQNGDRLTVLACANSADSIKNKTSDD